MNVHTECRYWSVAVVMESSDNLVFFFFLQVRCNITNRRTLRC